MSKPAPGTPNTSNCHFLTVSDAGRLAVTGPGWHPAGLEVHMGVILFYLWPEVFYTVSTWRIEIDVCQLEVFYLYYYLFIICRDTNLEETEVTRGQPSQSDNHVCYWRSSQNSQSTCMGTIFVDIKIQLNYSQSKTQCEITTNDALREFAQKKQKQPFTRRQDKFTYSLSYTTLSMESQINPLLQKTILSLQSTRD